MDDQSSVPEPTTNESSLRFLDFPMKIRIIIYQFLLQKHELIDYFKKVRLHPSIVRTCRQVLSEAHPILYGQNTIKMSIDNTSGPEYTTYEGISRLERHDYHRPIEMNRRL